MFRTRPLPKNRLPFFMDSMLILMVEIFFYKSFEEIDSNFFFVSSNKALAFLSP